MTLKEQVAEDLKTLNEAELKQVAEYLTFLKFRSRSKTIPQFDENQLAALDAEFADEDQALADEGLSEYAESLEKEDAR